MSDRATATPRFRVLTRWIWTAVVGTCLTVLGSSAGWAKDETWRQEGAAAFAKAHREGVVVSDSGGTRLGHAISPVGMLGAERVWDLARTRTGTVFVATGDAGKVFRREPQKDAAWTLAYDSTDSQALALAVGPDQTVFVGTGPGGQVINLSDPKHPSSRPDPKVQYIWDLAIDSKGILYAATGPQGQLWRRSGEGKWSLQLDSKATHLLCVMIGPDGSVYTGSDGEGLIYRVGTDGKVSILFDAPQSEVRSLAWGADGALYAGTAAEAGGSGGTTRSSMFLTHAGASQLLDGTLGDRETTAVAARNDGERAPLLAQPPPPSPGLSPRAPISRSAQGGSASPKPIAVGDNAVYRIDADGVPREVLRVKALVHALAWSDDRLLVGTGPEGQLYEVRSHGEETAPIAKLDRGQILSLLAQPDGGIMMGTGDPGSVVELASGHAAVGRLMSDVHDTRLVSRFGALSWRGDQPAGTSITFQSRTGNVGEPDETWSAWSAEQTDPTASSVASPPGRFVQYRATLGTTDPRHTPELRSVALSFRTANLSPEISRLEVPDLSASDGAARQTRLNLRWDASDPNDDDLGFLLKVRKEGWPDWIGITEEPITEKTFAWDTSAFPSGFYRLKLIAGDRPSNSPANALTRERESPTFIVDHDSPRVSLTPTGRGATIVLTDDLTRLVKADYTLDGGPRTPIFPADGLFDTSRETINLTLPDLKKGVHLIMVHATDSAGNVGSGDALIEVKD